MRANLTTNRFIVIDGSKETRGTENQSSSQMHPFLRLAPTEGFVGRQCSTLNACLPPATENKVRQPALRVTCLCVCSNFDELTLHG